MASQQPPRIALALREPLPWSELVELARTAEDTGYETIFVPEIAWREAFSTLTGLAMRTDRVGLATGIVPIENRSARATAMAAATLHELSGGRFVLGLGAGHRSLDELERYAAEVRSAMPAELVGEPGAAEIARGRRGPPVWFAGLGDRAVELAAREADGVLLNWCSPERVARARETVGRTSRRGHGFTVTVYVRCCVQATDDGDVAAALATATATYVAMPHYRRQFEVMGLGEEAAEVANGGSGSGDALARLVDAVCIRGDRDTFVRRASEYGEAGADVVVVYPVPVHDPLTSTLGTILAAAPSPAVER